MVLWLTYSVHHTFTERKLGALFVSTADWADVFVKGSRSTDWSGKCALSSTHIQSWLLFRFCTWSWAKCKSTDTLLVCSLSSGCIQVLASTTVLLQTLPTCKVDSGVLLIWFRIVDQYFILLTTFIRKNIQCSVYFITVLNYILILHKVADLYAQ